MPAVSFGEPLITYRSDLSTLYRVFKKIARPIRSHIIKVEGDFPAGSPRLEKRPRRVGKVNIEERLIEIGTGAKSCSIIKEEKLWVYEFLSPTSSTSDRSKFEIKGNHIVYFFAGGGFVQPAASEQWKFCAYLASSLAQEGVRVVLISYPLAPNSPAKDSLPLLRRWLAQALREAEAENSTVSLVGDSAGGNIALSLALWWADQLALRSKVEATEVATRSSLRSILMISPPLDMRVINPDIARVDEWDPILGKANAENAARNWSRGSDTSDPYLSPVLSDLAALRTSGVLVNCIIGMHDVLAPDVMVFLEKCRKRGVKGEWLLWEGMMHDFPLAARYGLQEGKEARAWVLESLRSVSRSSDKSE
ncbi:Alpha/Beta hydrolase protein [Xylaria venustula]|nr:Alpha/Beta hydrolase protein [Xylaria venustula]